MDYKTPFRIDNIDINNIKYTSIKSNEKKTIVYIKYEDNNKLKNLVFQSPTLLNINNAIQKNNFYELDIPLAGKDNEKVNEFRSFLSDLDSKILNDAKRHSNWFNNFLKNNKIKYQKTTRITDNKLFKNGMLRIKIVISNDFETLLQINNKEKISEDDIPRDSWVKMILEVYAIWINDNGFGLFIRPILISFKPKNFIDYNYKLVDDSDELDDVIHTVNDNSIFIKADSAISESKEKNIGNTTSALEVPNMSNYFEELPEDILDEDSSSFSNHKEKLSSTSSQIKSSSTSSIEENNINYT